jgi:hypothetical protein
MGPSLSFTLSINLTVTYIHHHKNGFFLTASKRSDSICSSAIHGADPLPPRRAISATMTPPEGQQGLVYGFCIVT